MLVAPGDELGRQLHVGAEHPLPVINHVGLDLGFVDGERIRLDGFHIFSVPLVADQRFPAAFGQLDSAERQKANSVSLVDVTSLHREPDRRVKSHFSRIFGCLGVLAVLIVVWVMLRPDKSMPLEDPIVAGHSIRWWVTEMIATQSDEASVVLKTNQAVAVPHMIQIFENREKGSDRIRAILARPLSSIWPSVAKWIAPERLNIGWAHMLLMRASTVGPDERLTQLILRSLKDSDPKTRVFAIYGVHPQLSANQSQLVIGLQGVLLDSETSVRRAANWRLSGLINSQYAEFRSNAVVLRPMLVRLSQNDPDEGVRTNAAAALLGLPR